MDFVVTFLICYAACWITIRREVNRIMEADYKYWRDFLAKERAKLDDR